jgi:MoaA/NifB/PqqE/SkfB family radical SAM enzyme
MPLELALRLVDEASQMGNFSCVGFTGGEVLLFPEDILVIADRIQANGLSFTVATAAHWAGSTTEASALVSELHARGLTRMNISHDPSHAEFVPREYVINAALASSSMGIPTYIIGTFADREMDLETYLPELKNAENVGMVTKLIAKVGRASKADISRAKYGLTTTLDDLACYRQIYHDIVVFWDGRTYPCCSTFNRATKGILLGNAFEDSLTDLWYRAEGSLLFRVMKRQGFGRLYAIVKEADPDLYAELPAIESAVGPCSLCNLIFRDKDLGNRVKEVFAAYELQRIEEQIEALHAHLGSDRVARIMEEMAAQVSSLRVV